MERRRKHCVKCIFFSAMKMSTNFDIETLVLSYINLRVSIEDLTISNCKRMKFYDDYKIFHVQKCIFEVHNSPHPLPTTNQTKQHRKWSMINPIIYLC